MLYPASRVDWMVEFFYCRNAHGWFMELVDEIAVLMLSYRYIERYISKRIKNVQK